MLYPSRRDFGRRACRALDSGSARSLRNLAARNDQRPRGLQELRTELPGAGAAPARQLASITRPSQLFMPRHNFFFDRVGVSVGNVGVIG